MDEIKLNWWDHVCVFFTMWWMIFRYGLEGAEKEADVKLERLEKRKRELENKQSILDNWR